MNPKPPEPPPVPPPPLQPIGSNSQITQPRRASFVGAAEAKPLTRKATTSKPTLIGGA